MASNDSILATSLGLAARSIPSVRKVVYKSYTTGFSRFTTSASMLDSISMSAMRGASAILSRSGASQSGWVREGVDSDDALTTDDAASSASPPRTVRSRRSLDAVVE